jgi:hypothetical protein
LAVEQRQFNFSIVEPRAIRRRVDELKPVPKRFYSLWWKRFVLSSRCVGFEIIEHQADLRSFWIPLLGDLLHKQRPVSFLFRVIYLYVLLAFKWFAGHKDVDLVLADVVVFLPLVLPGFMAMEPSCISINCLGRKFLSPDHLITLATELRNH